MTSYEKLATSESGQTCANGRLLPVSILSIELASQARFVSFGKDRDL